MIARYHGQTWNAAEFARALGASEATARRHLDILAGAFMVRDSGILHTLPGLAREDGQTPLQGNRRSPAQCGELWRNRPGDQYLSRGVAREEAVMRTRIALVVGVGFVGLLFFVGANPSAPPEEMTASVGDPRGMSQQEQDRASQVRRDAAKHLREAADCLDVTRRSLLDVFSSPGREQSIVNGVAQACGLAFIQYSGMSREARALVEQAVGRVDMNDLAHVENEEELDSVLDDIIAEYNREADQLEGR